MLSSIFRYTSYMILVFGFFYMSWHFGRAYEKGAFDHVAVVSASEQATDCKEVRQEIQDYKRVYQEVLKELDEPTPKADLNNRYMEFTKR
ncbi:MAG: hypothetical protein DHS20C13_01490 [Thermodesulfobacteriota bacterium]|nr:MAG: hypothetical protein DHS20C13_01490 [Thermodesulfobacteriota bacterium]